MPVPADRPIAIYHEHPDWFRPLFTALERRGVPYARLDAATHRYDPSAPAPPYALVFNRMSPSAWKRDHGHAIFHTLHYLAHLERSGVRVVNGSDAFTVEISKARQLSLLEGLGLPYPRARAIHDPRHAPAAAEGLRYPVVVKPGVGGSGAGVRRFEDARALRVAAAEGGFDLGFDHSGLVQECLPAEESRIVRVEVVGGRFLYGIRVYTDGSSFDLCPADICQGVDGAELKRSACPVDAPKNGLRVEAYTPPATIVAEVERIMEAANIEVGGVEYLVDARDGRQSYYDVNALSNFVADSPRVVGFDAYERLADYLVAEAERATGVDAPALAGQGGLTMRYGYWLPVFGGWLRNVPEEGMEASWEFVRRLALRSEAIGFDLTLVAELNLNDIKGVDAPALDAWSTAAALAAVTARLEIMIAVRPTFHPPALCAKQVANLDHLSGGRVSLNVVSSWWRDEARQYGVEFDEHDARYGRTAEWLAVVSGMWSEARFSYRGRHYGVEDAVLEPKPTHGARPVLYAGGESEAAKELIARSCDGYLMHGDPVAKIAARIADLSARRTRAGQARAPGLTFGVAAYVVCRDTAAEAERERVRITTLKPGAPGFENFAQWVGGTKLEEQLKIEDYSVSNRGLRAGLVGTPNAIAGRILEFERAGVDLLLLQFSPQEEEMERFARDVMPRVEALRAPDVLAAAR